MTKHIAVLLLVGTSLLLCSCGTNNSGSANSSDNTEKRMIQTFERDNYTLKIGSDYVEVSSEQDTEEDETTKLSAHGYDTTLAEITLVGDDNSVAYEIVDGTDIKYNGILFKNLYTNINSIDTNYNRNTLINFIIKTYNANSSLIYTFLTKDEIDAEDSDVQSTTLDELIDYVPNYQIAKNNHGEAVTWMLTLTDSETRSEVQMYGCNSYIILTSDGNNTEVDMTTYDSGVIKSETTGVDNVTEENTTESAEENEENEE